MTESDERTPHRVAVVVFATVNAVDQVDAEHVVRRVLQDGVLRSPHRVNPNRLPPVLRWSRAQPNDVTWDVAVHGVVPLHRVFTAGHLRVEPTNRAFPYDRDEDDL